MIVIRAILAYLSRNETARRFAVRAAAPTGGARRRLRQRVVRGCLFLSALAASPALANVPELPSGQSVTLSEVLQDRVGSEDWLRFRFVAPQIAREGGDISYAQAEADFEHLCTHVGRPYLVEYDLAPDVVVITLMDRPVPFGTADPQATQFIEAFRIVDDACVLDSF